MSWSFDTINIREALKDLKPSTPAQWGRMSAQQMVEHLTIVLRISNGKKKAPVVTPEEKLPKMVAFLHTEMPLPRDFRAPFLPEEPLATFQRNLWEAIELLEEEIADFRAYYQEEPEKRETHPVFGPLNHKEWILFQNKHFQHHFEQFGIKLS